MSIGDLKINCSVLDDGTRIISNRSFSTFIGIKGGGKYWENKKAGKEVLPEFLSISILTEFISGDLKQKLLSPIQYLAMNGVNAEGIEGTIIPEICEVWIKALNAGKLNEKQKEVALKAQDLIGAFARVGIIALIDEVTGYKKKQDDYQSVLQAYIAESIRPWVKTFREEYYQQIYKLMDWDWDNFTIKGINHPQYVGKITNEIVYKKLPIGVLEELQTLNPTGAKGTRKHKHHQLLSESVGYKRLIEHLGSVTTIMRMFDKGQFMEAKAKIDSMFPDEREYTQLSLDFPMPLENLIGKNGERELSGFNQKLKKGLEFDPKD